MFVCAHPAIDPAARAAAHAADRPRPRCGADRLGVPGRAGDAVAAARPRQDQDPQRRHRLRGAGRRRVAEPARRRARGDLRRLWHRLGRCRRHRPRAQRPRPEASDARGDARPTSLPMPPEALGPARAARCSASRARRRGAMAPATTCRCSRRTRRCWDRELLGVGRSGAAATPAALGAPGALPARGGDPVGAHAAPSRRERSRRGDRRALRRAGRDPADDRCDRQPRLRRRRGAAAPPPAAPRWRASPPKDVDGYQPYWAALAHLAAADGDAATARAARERAVGLSTDPAVRRFLLRAS